MATFIKYQIIQEIFFFYDFDLLAFLSPNPSPHAGRGNRELKENCVAKIEDEKNFFLV